MSTATSALAPRERPILFSDPMILALLAGTKTQTRRIVRIDDSPVVIGDGPNARLPKQRGIPSDATNVRHIGPYLKCDAPRASNTVSSRVLCPYGVPGDRLWVKEAFALVDDGTHYDGPLPLAFRSGVEWAVAYRADHGASTPHPRWYSPLFMSRWASRITLEVTDVRVERLQAITEQDAEAEGVESLDGEIDEVALHATAKAIGGTATDARVWFATLWDSLNAKRGAPWSTNPWVWVVAFKRVTP